MASLPELAQWDLEIYQLELSDPVIGGPGGISNRQATQLANRTTYLKAQVESLETTVQSTATDISGFDARVTAVEGQVTAAEASIVTLQAGATSTATDITALQAAITALQNEKVDKADPRFTAAPRLDYASDADYRGNEGSDPSLLASTGFVDRRLSEGIEVDLENLPAAADLEHVFSHSRIIFTGNPLLNVVEIDTGTKPNQWIIVNKSGVSVSLLRGTSQILVSGPGEVIAYADATTITTFATGGGGSGGGNFAPITSPEFQGFPQTNNTAQEVRSLTKRVIVNNGVLGRRLAGVIEYPVSDATFSFNITPLQAGAGTHRFTDDGISSPFAYANFPDLENTYTIVNRGGFHVVCSAGGPRKVTVPPLSTRRIFTEPGVGCWSIDDDRRRSSPNFTAGFVQLFTTVNTQVWNAPLETSEIWVTMVGGGGGGGSGASVGGGANFQAGSDGSDTTFSKTSGTAFTITANGGGGGGNSDSTTFSPAGVYGGGTSTDYVVLRSRDSNIPYEPYLMPFPVGGPFHNGQSGGPESVLTDTGERLSRYGIGGAGGHGFVDMSAWAYDGSVDGQRGYRSGKGGYGAGAGGGGGAGDVQGTFTPAARAGGGGGGAGELILRRRFDIAPGDQFEISVGGGGAGGVLNKNGQSFQGGQGARGVVLIEW